MSKSDQQAVKGQANTQISQNTGNEGQANQELQSILGTAQGTAGSILPGVVGGYSDIASTGGYDPSILGTVNSTYGKLATTGGFSPDQMTAMRDQSTQAAQSTYQTGSDAAARVAKATGGYGLSGAVQEDLARQGSQAAGTAANNFTASIAPAIQQGMEAGASGLSNTQNSLVSNKLSATGGLTNIYGMNESQVTTTVDQILKNYQQTGQLNNQDLSILTNLANQPGIFDKIVGTIGTLGGAAAGVMSGIGRMKG